MELEKVYIICKSNQKALEEILSILEDMQIMVQDIFSRIVDLQTDSMCGFHEWDEDKLYN